jgi:hypothetical protein
MEVRPIGPQTPTLKFPAEMLALLPPSRQPWVAVGYFILKWSEVKWSEAKRIEANRSEAKRSESKRSESKRSEAKWSEVKWSEVKWSEVKWSEVSYGKVLADKVMHISVILYCEHLIILWLFHLGVSCTVFVSICTVVVLHWFVMRVWGGGVVMCGCFGSLYTVLWQRFSLTWLRFFLPCLKFCRAFSSVVRQMPE